MNPETEHPDPYAVYRAVERGDEEELRRLLQVRAPKDTIVRGDTALMLAIKRRNVSFVKLLVEHGADCSRVDRFSTPPLQRAVMSDIPDMLLIFTPACVDMDQRDLLGDTALHYTVNRPDELINRKILMQLLIDRGADINARNRLWVTPLHYAAENGHVAAMQFLIDHGADMNARNRLGHTPLHYAAENGHVDAMQFLIDRGADMNAVCNNGNTPLHYAAMYNKFECLRVLVLAGARMSPGAYNKSPLHWAVINDNQATARFLIMHNCDTDILDDDGLTALEFCRRNNIGPLPAASLEMAEMLQDAIRERYENRTSALMMGHHPRLGERSRIRDLPPDLLREMFEKGH